MKSIVDEIYKTPRLVKHINGGISLVLSDGTGVLVGASRNTTWSIGDKVDKCYVDSASIFDGTVTLSNK